MTICQKPGVVNFGLNVPKIKKKLAKSAFLIVKIARNVTKIDAAGEGGARPWLSMYVRAFKKGSSRLSGLPT